MPVLIYPTTPKGWYSIGVPKRQSSHISLSFGELIDSFGSFRSRSSSQVTLSVTSSARTHGGVTSQAVLRNRDATTHWFYLTKEISMLRKIQANAREI